jgi:hypothetical protein
VSSYRLLSAALLAFAVLGAGCSAAGTPSLAPTGVQAERAPRSHGRPIADATHSYIYVADAYSNTVWIFPANSANPDPNPTGSITTGLSGPQGVAVDAGGNLYVANANNDSVTIYPPGSSSPSLTLSKDLTSPSAVAVDSKGNVWVSNQLGSNEGSVVEFPSGQTTPSTVISGINPLGVALDSNDNLYVENYNNSAAFVSVYPPGATTPSHEFGGGTLLEPLGITVGPSGDVYVSDYYYNKLFIYSKKYKLRKSTFYEIGGMLGLTLSRNKRLYIGEGSNDVVNELSGRGFGELLSDELHNSLSSSFGVAADPEVKPGP